MFSTRLPEEAIHELDDASRRLGITRKQVLAEAIMLRATDTSRERAREILARAAGSWHARKHPRKRSRKRRNRFVRHGATTKASPPNRSFANVLRCRCGDLTPAWA